MQEFLVTILLGFSSLLSIENLPKETGSWKIEKNWVSENGSWVFSAKNNDLGKLCGNSESSLVLPQVIHGIHKIYANEKLIYDTGDDTFQKTSAFYQRGTLSCKYLKDVDEISWSVRTYSQYFARLNVMPIIVETKVKDFFFDVVLNLIASACLILLSFFSFFLFKKRVKNEQIISLIVGMSSLSIYFAMTSANYLGISVSMFGAHKIADVFVWIGSASYIYFFKKFNYLGKFEYYGFAASFLIAELIILLGNSADVIQFGTTLPMPFTLICLISFLAHAFFKGYRYGFDKNRILEIFSLSSFTISGGNDLLHVMGLIDSYMFFPIGATFSGLFIAIAVNQDIDKTYLERDDLVKNLKDKVDEQTKHLTSALQLVKQSQADLVQSARLASLGTLSAGIAHEINNAINYVNGAVVPLERKVMKSIPEADRQITEKLFSAIKEGTSITVDIVRSLRNFTGLNQAKVKDVSLKDTVNSVLTILKTKLSKITIELKIEENLTLTCYQVGLNQIFMNIISNAIDAVPDIGGRITIEAYSVNTKEVEIKISDNGSGMNEETKSQIFDAFYTTKTVGKGTGLGLHIVQKEVERHQGSIKVKSELKLGTTFIIRILKNIDTNTVGEAA